MLRTPDTQPLASPLEHTSENNKNGHIAAKPPANWKQIIRKPLGLAIGLGLLAFIITTVLPKKYNVVSTLYFPSAPSTSLLTSALGKGTQDGSAAVPLIGNVLSSPQVATSPQTAIALLNSDTCTKNVALECNLPAIWKKSLPETMDQLDAVSDFSLDKNGLLAISVTDHDPKLAVQITQSYTRNLIKQADDTSNSMSHRNTQFIRNRIKTVTADLRVKQKLLDTLESKTHTMPDISGLTSEIATPPSAMAVGGGGSALSALGGSSGMSSGSGSSGGSMSSLMGGGATAAASGSYLAIVAQQDHLKAEIAGTDAEIAKATEQAQTALNKGENVSAQVPVAMEERIRLRDLEAQLEDARKTLGPDNPTYRGIALQVQTAQGQFNAEMQRERDALKMGITPQLAELEAERSNEQAVLDKINIQAKKAASDLAKLPSFQTHIINLEYQVITDFEVLKLQSASLELAIDAENRDMPTFSVIDPPTVPEKPSFPKRGASTIFAAIGGIIIGLLWQYWPNLRQQWSAGTDQA